jgi:hypothetical protein
VLDDVDAHRPGRVLADAHRRVVGSEHEPDGSGHTGGRERSHPVLDEGWGVLHAELDPKAVAQLGLEPRRLTAGHVEQG